MDFTLTDEQELLRDGARSLLTDRCTTELVRAQIDDSSAIDGLVAELAEWSALGAGPLVDLCLFLEETGAVALPGPTFVTTALFIPLLAELDHPLADAAAEGELTGTVAAADATGRWAPNDGATKSFVLEADRADVVAVVDPGKVRILEGADATPLETIDLTRRVYDVDASTDGETVAMPEDVWTAIERRACVALAADTLGTCRWLLDAAISYAQVREQFDRPIGSFQAIKHLLADSALELERAWAAVYYAAMAIDADHDDAPRAAHVAKATAGQAATHLAKDAIQVHGGIGFTYEHDLHLVLRRAYASAHLMGTAEEHLDRLAELEPA